MPVTSESLRFQIIKKDLNKSDRELAKLFGVSPTTIGRMLKGDQELNFTVISIICGKLGYSPGWLLLGNDDKKLKSNEENVLTDIQMLRMELDINATLNLKLQARLTDLEKKVERLEQNKP